MSLRYKLFGKPQNLEEFLDKAKKETISEIEVGVEDLTFYSFLTADDGLLVPTLLARIDLNYSDQNGKKIRYKAAKFIDKSLRLGIGHDDPIYDSKVIREFQKKIIEEKDKIYKTVSNYSFKIKDISNYNNLFKLNPVLLDIF